MGQYQKSIYFDTMYLSKLLRLYKYSISYTSCLAVLDVHMDSIVVQPLSSCIMVCVVSERERDL